MIEVRQTLVFVKWLDGLKDLRGRAQILRRIERVQAGNIGDVAPVGGGVGELRIHHGPGYRFYITQRGREMILLLCGGSKATQRRDIDKAMAMARELEYGT